MLGELEQVLVTPLEGMYFGALCLIKLPHQINGL